jgi:hypothetical protein
LSKIVSTKKINVIFLATVLIVGTFALMYSSFMNNAQAELGYDKPQYPSYNPDYNYKSKDAIGIKKVNCNNVNLNVNDASVNVGRPPIGDFTSLDTPETENQEITANNFANGEKPNNVFKKDNDGFVYVYINNNNNQGAGGGDGGGDGPTPECEAFVACFNNPEFSEPANQIVTALERTGELIIKGVPGFADGYVIGEDVLTPEELCEWLLFTPQSNGQVITTQEQLDPIIDALASPEPIGGFIECLGESVGFLPPSEP